ncbi:MAG: DUF6029 family protein [bacterium]
MQKRVLLACVMAIVLLSPLNLLAQDDNKVTLRGSLQTEMMIPQVDSVIGATDYAGDFLSNTYINLQLTSKYITAGARMEIMDTPLPGFEDAFAGSGLTNVFVTGKYKWFEITVGDIYDQFGSGLIFRSYEDRPLGIDNSLRGARLVLEPYKGIRLKGLAGMQRNYFNFNSDNYYGFDYTQGAVMGGDLELNIDEWFPAMQEKDYRLMLGGSYVSKYDPDEVIQPSALYRLNLPEYVGSADVRVRFQKGGWNALAEYAYKANDPSNDNGYIYKPGNATLLSLTYAERGMSFIVQAKRSDNMSYRADRTGSGTSGFINHMPAFSMTHTYALAALYPYATQTQGEWAYQAEARYTFKRKTTLGGKYGTNIRANITYVCGLDTTGVTMVNGSYQGTNGYTTSLFGHGDETYYLDAHLEVSKKLSKTFSFTAMYMYQQYNQKVIEGHGTNGDIVNSNIFIFEGKYKHSSNIGMRAELQYLHTAQDLGDWAYGLYEISLYKKVLIELSDMYNVGTTNQHYYKVAAAYTEGAHRVQLSYGRTRAGYNCSGGVCRYVPASKGMSISYFVNF